MTSHAPLVSIVMPAFNAADTIEEALQSLERQSYRHLEIVVVDDGSEDRSGAIAESQRDRRVLVHRQDHRGLVSALQAGCARANGGYIARLDADDVANDNRIGAQVAYLEARPDVGLLGSYARLVSSDGREWLFEPPVEDDALRRYLLWDNPLVHSSVMFRRAAYDAAGGYTGGPNEDYRLWIRIARSWSLAIVPEVLVTHRIRRTSHSRSMRRPAALRTRLAAQWEAAKTLGPWSQALPALAMTGVSLVLAAIGFDVGAGLRRFAGSATARSRGLRDVRQRRADDR